MLTVDVEDYFQVSAFAKSVDRASWDNYPLRVEKNTHQILDLFDRHNTKATFFVLGWVAERLPGLVMEIAGRGHEIASHGYSHQLIYNQSKTVFEEETRRSKKILEDIVQRPVLGYRAASYSITPNSKWALDVLIEAGFKYDSSIFPIRHDRYGMPGAPDYPHHIIRESGRIFEFPLTSLNIFGYRLPVAGGGYFRLYPYWLTRMLLKAARRQTGNAFIFYIHPWEVDDQQPRIEATRLSRFRHYNNLEKCEARLEKLLSDFEFTTIKQMMDDMDIHAEDVAAGVQY